LLSIGGVTITLALSGCAASPLNVTTPQFRPSTGWHVGAKPAHGCVDVARSGCVQAEAWASTVPYRDCPNCVAPHNTLAALPPDGIVIQLSDGRERPVYKTPIVDHWPARIHRSQVNCCGSEGVPDRFSEVQTLVRSQDGVEHDLVIWFGRQHPTKQQLAHANAELLTLQPS
jgi:hypothetical protein